MKTYCTILFTLFFSCVLLGQNLTPEVLIGVGRLSALGMTDNNENVVYKVTKINVADESKTSQIFKIPVKGGDAKALTTLEGIFKDRSISPDNKYKIVVEEVKLKKVFGTDYYPELTKSNVQIYESLNYRHWDTWEDGAYSHLVLESTNGKMERIDIMKDEPYDCPQKPFGGAEDFLWSPDGKCIIYVSKKLHGTDYALSTNTDIYCYNIETKETKNLTAYNKGYDTQPSFSNKGMLAWLQMNRDGYESDKNDLVINLDDSHINLTKKWDGTVNGFHWSNSGDRIYFTAPVQGTEQLFEIIIPKSKDKIFPPKQITTGQFDVHGIVGHNSTHIVVYRRDMNHASELYTIELKSGKMSQLSHINDDLYKSIKLSKVEKRITKATDGKDLLSWVIYPPDFDSTKQYPTLLYCQGGPQGALSQLYSLRWNFQLMAAHGYIVIAPNRRGMPGYGVEWNEQISTDYGGQNMLDYLSAIDDLATEKYVDKSRIGCIGASYGGYSVFYLAAIHKGRFKSFISHDGIFNWKSMYGTTEELFFVNWDLGGPYWDKENSLAQKSYTDFNPVEHVQKWSSPIMVIQGGLDFRVPIGQGLEAFQAAQLQGIKSKLLYFPDENHWVLDYQNSLIWHKEFYKWLDETLKN
jgi:dipeptidyl aminopeptidase/acylaminoacyl peptidase